MISNTASPEGYSPSGRTIVSAMHGLSNGNPAVMYQQGEHNTCLFDAASSVFAYFGDMSAANKIACLKDQKLSANKTCITVINETLIKGKDGYSIIKLDCDWSMDNVTFTPSKWYMTSNEKCLQSSFAFARKYADLIPKVGIIKSSDGCVGHAIGIFLNYIFDSNLSHAL